MRIVQHFMILVFVLFATNVWAERLATMSELEAICTGSTPQRLSIVSSREELARACEIVLRRLNGPIEANDRGRRLIIDEEDAIFPPLETNEVAAPTAHSEMPNLPESPATPMGFALDRENPCNDPALTTNIPQRSENGIPQLNSNMGSQRDGQIVSSVRSGNIPDFLRDLRPVTVAPTSCMGTTNVSITLCVMPDYLAVGDNDNYVHTPMGIDAATQIAGEMGFFLPTTTMVNAIHFQGQTRVAPSPRTSDGSMTTTSVFSEHSRAVQRQFNGRENLLRVGHKKDVVMTNRSGGVPIYGWHRVGGAPIQSLYLGHGRTYSDYSHGIRLVSQQAFVGAQRYALADLLQDPQCAQALSIEGPIEDDVLDRYPSPQGHVRAGLANINGTVDPSER